MISRKNIGTGLCALGLAGLVYYLYDGSNSLASIRNLNHESPMKEYVEVRRKLFYLDNDHVFRDCQDLYSTIQSTTATWSRYKLPIQSDLMGAISLQCHSFYNLREELLRRKAKLRRSPAIAPIFKEKIKLDDRLTLDIEILLASFLSIGTGLGIYSFNRNRKNNPKHL